MSQYISKRLSKAPQSHGFFISGFSDIESINVTKPKLVIGGPRQKAELTQISYKKKRSKAIIGLTSCKTFKYEQYNV